MKVHQTDTVYEANIVKVPLPHTGYVDRVLRSNSYEELMWKFIDAEHPAKEISESYAAFSNLKRVCRINHHNWLHIGDGGHTRTAAIFAFFSKCINFSIDPDLNLEKFSSWRSRYDIARIIPVKGKFEGFDNNDYLSFIEPIGYNHLPYSITCVHAHVNLEEVDKVYSDWRYLYTNPCCHPEKQTFSKEYMDSKGIVEVINKRDLGILSPEREIRIYRKLQS